MNSTQLAVLAVAAAGCALAISACRSGVNPQPPAFTHATAVCGEAWR
jgi:hypothetical protein